ncbi:MAG: hypothetical protein HY812_21325 [Planctomycetes bacterium]|nr:hypothetical protein [Planctomycetota bacterium]
MIRARRVLPLLLRGLLLAALGATAPSWADAPLVRRLLVDERAAECEAREPGPPGFFRRCLEERHDALRFDLRALLIALGAGIALAAAGRLHPRTRRSASAPLAGPLLGALLLVALELCVQTRLLARAMGDGLFTASRAERNERFFGRATAAAERIIARVPAGDRILLIDFADPGDVQNVGYLVFPRRTFALPRPELRLDADTFRETLRREPRGLDWCREAGYTFAVDLRRLVVDLDETALIPLAAAAEDR